MSHHSLSWMSPPEESLWGGAITIGNFDGVHRGHQELVRRAKHWATELHGPCLAITFDPPPVILLQPTAWKPPLTTLADKVALLQAAGADKVILLRTDAGLLSLSPEAFFEDVILRHLGAKAVVEGYNFCFGRGRTGDTQLLRDLCGTAGISFEEVSPLLHQEEPISSSRVRKALACGEIASVSQLLGRLYSVAGEVIRGAQRGRTIGFPTANLGPVTTQLPGDGVYAGWAIVLGTRHQAVANVGPAPTFGEMARKVEIHLLDFTGQLYGETVIFEFQAKLRETVPFPSLDALIDQLRHDVESARQLLNPGSATDLG